MNNVINAAYLMSVGAGMLWSGHVALRNCERRSARLCREVSFSVYVFLDFFLCYYKGLTYLEGADYVS